MRARNWMGLGAVLLATLARPATAAPIFDLSYDPGIDPLALAGFQQAANVWANLLDDSITLEFDIGFETLSPGILGGASSTSWLFDYSAVASALVFDITSVGDSIAVGSLPAGSAIDLLINNTADNPNGVGAPTPYVDADDSANNSLLYLTQANAKALGAVIAGADADIRFSDAYTWDFDPSDGIAPGTFDFVGAAVHEIGHALGFTSGVDVLDYNSLSPGPYYNADDFTFVTPLDLYRWSPDSYALGVRDWTARDAGQYFSIDGGATNLASFSTGVFSGDGNQASHWQEGGGFGIMNPTLAPGVTFGDPSVFDLIALDVIGWNLTSAAPIPEPSALALVLVGVGVLVRRRRA